MLNTVRNAGTRRKHSMRHVHHLLVYTTKRPLFKKTPRNSFKQHSFKKMLFNLCVIGSRKSIEEHDRTLDPGNIRDFIDGYLLEIRKRKNDPAFSSKYLIRNKKNIKTVIVLLCQHTDEVS